MEPSAILEAMLDLAQDAGVKVHPVARDGREGGDLVARSGVVRVKEDVWVLLSDSDPVSIQLEVLAGALRAHAADTVANSYVPPAVRALLEEPDRNGGRESGPG